MGDSPISFDDGEDLSTASALKQMTQAWQNELAAPSLLPTHGDLLECLLDQIQGMEENILKQKNALQSRVSRHRMELQRISYITSDYMRCRMRKIEEHANSLMNEHLKRLSENQPPLLSQSEMSYAQAIFQADAKLYDKSISNFLPTALRKIPGPREDISTDMVYAKVIEDNVENVSIPDWSDPNSEIILELEKDTIHLIPFQSVKTLIEEKKLELL